MQLVLTPHYRDLFPGEEDKLDHLFAGIPSVLVLQLVSLMDAELYSRDEGNATQIKLFNFLLSRQPESRRLLILNHAIGGPRFPDTQYRLFSRHYNLNLLHYVLLNFQPGEEREVNPQEELNIFKAYFLAAQLFGQEMIPKDIRHALDADYFGKMMWPSLLDNFEIGHPVHPYFNMLRGVVFLNYMQFRTPYKNYVENFLRKNGKPSALNYVLDVFNMVSVNYQSLKVPGYQFAAFTLPRSEGFDALYANFTMDLTKYQEKYKGKKANYAGIKAQPMFHLSENTWIVMNWTFLSQKLYEGLLFDFYESSGIAGEKQFENIPAFKRFIGEHITERHLFKQLAKGTWNRKFEVLLFDEGGKSQGVPDAYYRRGNKLFLFEIKDAFFAGEVVNSFSFEQIKEEIDKKINQKGKGTGQLVKQLQRLIAQPFEAKPGYRRTEDLEVYPVIVYTDIHFGMAGFNEYVGRSFTQMVDAAGVRQHFKKIWPVTLIHIDHLIEHFHLYANQQTALDKWLEYYHHQIDLRRKKHQRLNRLELYQEIFGVFEDVTRPLAKGKLTGPKLIEWTGRVLNLTEGLNAD